MAPTTFPDCCHDGFVRSLRSALPARPRRRAGAQCHGRRARGFAFAAGAGGRSHPRAERVRAGFSQSASAWRRASTRTPRSPDALLRLGFGFAEVGTLTPRPQAGNPKPRLFRLHEDRGSSTASASTIDGARGGARKLAAPGARAAAWSASTSAPTRTPPTAPPITCAGVKCFADLASYFTVNISSPNTPGLRDLQQASALDDLLARVIQARDEAAENLPRRPVLLKIAPDLALADLDDVVRVARERGVDGMIVSNTTLARPETLRDEIAMRDRRAVGRAAVRARHANAGPDLCAGRGAISADRRRRRGLPEAAWAKIEAGATLIAALFGAGL